METIITKPMNFKEAGKMEYGVKGIVDRSHYHAPEGRMKEQGEKEYGVNVIGHSHYHLPKALTKEAGELEYGTGIVVDIPAN